MTKGKAYKKLIVSYIHQERAKGYVQTAAIRLHGKWLERLGFLYGEKVNIKLWKKKLVITLVEDAEGDVSTKSITANRTRH